MKEKEKKIDEKMMEAAMGLPLVAPAPRFFVAPPVLEIAALDSFTPPAAEPIAQLTALFTSPPPDKKILVAIDSNLFHSIALLRAARWLASALDIKGDLVACGTKAEDKDKQILANCVHYLAALCGGAKLVRLHSSDDKALTHNLPLIALEEAHLGRVFDPAAGSKVIERLTRTFAEKTWAALGNTAPLPESFPENTAPPAAITPSDEQIEIKNFYLPTDIPSDFPQHSRPGAPPFLRGPYRTMYLSKPWTIRQYAGFSTAEDSNAFYRHALANGQKGLSVAFDLPTHRGFDSDNKQVLFDVGMAGVAIDCLEDMRVLFDGIPLDKVSVSMTMNGAVLPIMALYIAAAAEQGVAPEQLAGTIQNDILKEFMVRNTYIYPPKESMRIVSDIFSFAAAHMPKFNTISISGYHMQEAGASKDLELAYTLADGMAYVRAGMAAGMDVDDFAPRLSFFWCIGMDFFMEVAKMRAARVLWAEIMADFGAQNEKSLALRTHCQTSGWSLSSRSVRNNVVRTCFEAMAAIGGGTQSLHTNALDEAIALPSKKAAALARETQLFLQRESDLCTTIDGWGGSFYVERLTSNLCARARSLIAEIESEGGMVEAIAKGIPKKRIEEVATRTQARIDKGERVIVGVNKYQSDGDDDIDILKIDNMAVRENQKQRLRTSRANRDETLLLKHLDALTSAAQGKDNLLAACVEAAKAGATVGEMSLAMEKIFTRYHAKPEMVKGVYGAASAGNERVANARAIAAAFHEKRGYRPHIFIAKAGQDGHDRGQKVVAAAYADMGFDVSLGALFQTAGEVAATAIKVGAHIVAISSLAGAHLPLAEELVKALKGAERGDILVVVGGIIPNDDVAPLKLSGVDEVFPPGTDVSASAVLLLELLRGRN